MTQTQGPSHGDTRSVTEPSDHTAGHEVSEKLPEPGGAATHPADQDRSDDMPSFAAEAQSVARRSLNGRPSFIVGIGASAGGLQAIEEFFSRMPADSGLAFVIIQHLSPDFKSLMDEILSRRTEIPIHRAENEMRVHPNAIYLIPPKKDMIISSGKLLLTDRDSSHGLNLPIDMFLRSLAQDMEDHSIAVILSGTGSDGSRGVRAIHEAGGFVLVQDASTAKFDNMPRAAVATGFADVVEEPTSMFETILRYVKHPSTLVERQTAKSPIVEAEYNPLNDIFQMLRVRFGIDFNHYRGATVDRRLGRRIAICRCSDLEQYVQYLNDFPAELNSLYHDLLIGVTRFYRDPKAFEFIESEVFPAILENRDPSLDDKVRIWVPGCATGEEAYSLAISLVEYCRQHKMNLDIKVFATDVHRESLDTASNGVFQKEEVEEISPERLKNYFIKDGKTYRIVREIRKMVIFAPQNLVADPPFTKIDLISCRNLLIYFDTVTQQKVLSLFHFALTRGGYLFLGPSENLGEVEDEFDEQSSKWKVYRKRRDVRLPRVGMVQTDHSTLRVRGRRSIPSTYGGRKSEPIVAWAYESLLANYVSSGYLIDESKELIHVYGQAKQYLLPPKGRPSTNLVQMIAEELGTAVTAAVHRATKNRASVVYKGVKAQTVDGHKTVTVSVSPLANKRTSTKFFFVAIEEIHSFSPAAPTDIEEDQVEEIDHDSQRVADLEAELRYTKENLQAANEELETSNEELQATNEELIAANEELQSTNEELQSTNEELQSTNEELHSVNEELHTVNVEYQKKIDELTQLTNDVENLLTSTEIGTIFLDRELNIRKYTPAVAGLFNLLPRDIGRPISHISSKIQIDQGDLISFANKVVHTGSLFEKEVQLNEGTWVLMRVLPYRDESHRTRGVVLTFLDITSSKQAQIEMKQYAYKLEASNKDLQDFAYVASHDLQAPLRSIIGFSKMLRKDAGVDLSDRANDDINRIGAAADRMKRSIEDLLEFSRVHSRGKEFLPCDCTELLDAAVDNLNAAIKDSGAVVTKSLMPTLAVDQLQIIQLFQNLIGNGIKFRGEDIPNIKISAIHRDHEWVFSVRDNGIGIPEGHLEDVFMIFKRLHAESDYAGTGLGLAICKRIVERHGGRTWVESTQGQGSEFFFSLPVSGVSV